MANGQTDGQLDRKVEREEDRQADGHTDRLRLNQREREWYFLQYQSTFSMPIKPFEPVSEEKLR